MHFLRPPPSRSLIIYNLPPKNVVKLQSYKFSKSTQPSHHHKRKYETMSLARSLVERQENACSLCNPKNPFARMQDRLDMKEASAANITAAESTEGKETRGPLMAGI